MTVTNSFGRADTIGADPTVVGGGDFHLTASSPVLRHCGADAGEGGAGAAPSEGGAPSSGGRGRAGGSGGAANAGRGGSGGASSAGRGGATPPTDGGGCGCRVAGDQRRSSTPLVLAVLALAAVARRRERSRS
jgi:MYXO-CTERM domain-containing protein